MPGLPELHYKADAARARRLLLVAGATVAVAAVLVAFGFALNPGPRWKIAATQDAEGNVLLDDDPVPAADVEALADLLQPGTWIEWRGHGDLELVSGGAVALAIAPGTLVTLPSPPPRYFARAARCTLAEGTLRIVPGPAFRGATLTIETPARSFTTGGDRPIAIVHDAAGTRVATSGPEIDAFVRSRGALVATPVEAAR